MEVKKFGELLKANNAIRLNEEWIIFNDFELYSFKTEKKKKYKSLEELVEANNFVRQIIESRETFGLEYAGGRGAGSTSSKAGVTSTYKFTKNENFKAKEFIKAVKKAQWSTDLDYDRGADWWLKKNQKAYGYKYSHTGNFAKK